MAEAELCRSLSYCPITGQFTWLVNSGRALAGSRAGTAGPNGYRRIMVNGVRYEEHRLAWFFGTGNWPRRLIDHKNGKPGDNRLENLREADRSQNAANSKQRNSGLKGASFHKATGLWQAQIMKNGKKIYLGLFETAEKAHAAYIAAATAEFAEFARAA